MKSIKIFAILTDKENEILPTCDFCENVLFDGLSWNGHRSHYCDLKCASYCESVDSIYCFSQLEEDTEEFFESDTYFTEFYGYDDFDLEELKKNGYIIKELSDNEI